MPDIDSLQIQVNASAEDASKGLDALYASLEKLKSMTKGGLGLTSTVNQLGKLNQAVGKMTSLSTSNLKGTIDALTGLKALQGVKLSSTVAKQIGEIGNASSQLSSEKVALIREIAPALSSLSAVKDVKISSTIGKGISEIMRAAGVINTVDLGKIAELSNAVSSLASIKDIRISSTLAKQVVELGTAAKELQGVDLAVFGNLAEALHPLSGIGKVSNLASALTQLKKIPEIMNQLSATDLASFKAQIQLLATALDPLASRMQSIANGFSAFPQRIQALIHSTNSLTRANYRGAGSYTDLYSAIRMASIAVRSIARVIAGWIGESNEYIENLNLFNASMGQYAREAQTYAEKVGELMGIDPSMWMRNQGVFMTLATGFGVASDRAYIMSKNLTQLGYDLSSFFNIRVDDAMQKLQSGISGELEPLRRLGYDLSQARLQAVALELGITKSFNAMTQAEKSQLRYYAIMTQVTTAQGDMARTLNAPANQLRILQAQATQAARALGNVFIPILNAVLPICIAVAKAVRLVAAAIASLFGFSLPEVDYSGIGESIGGAASGAGDLADNLGDAGGEAKKLKNYLMGFDELNVIDPTSSSGGGGGSGGGSGGGGGSDWDWDLPVYDFLDGLVNSTVDEWMKKLQPAVDWIKAHLEEILAVAAAIGAELLMWKIAKALIPDLGTIRGDLSKILSVATAAATIVVTAALVYEFDNKYMETGKWGYLIADGIATALGAYIAGKVVAHSFGTQKGYYTAAATLAISAGTTLKVVFDHITQAGFDGKALTASIWAVIKGAAAGGLLAIATGTSVVAGIAVGAVLTVTAGLILGIVAYSIHQNALRQAAFWGKVTLTAEEMRTYAEGLFDFDVEPRINLLSGVIENVETAKTALSTATELFNANLKRIEIGAQIDPDLANELTNQLTGENGLIPQLKSLLSESENQITVTFGIVPPKDTNGEDMDVADMLGNIIDTDKLLEAGIDDLGKQMSDLIVKGMEEGLTASEASLLQSIQQTLTNVSLALRTGSISGEFTSTLEYMLTDLDMDSFSGVLTAYQGMVEELTTSYMQAMTAAKSEMEGRLAAAYELRKQYVTQGNTEMVESMDATIAQLEANIAALDVAGSVEAAVSADTEKARVLFADALKEIFSVAVDPNWVNDGTFLSQWLHVFMTPNDASMQTVEEAAHAISSTLCETLSYELGSDNYQVLVQANELFGITEWDVLGDEMQMALYNSITELYGAEKTQQIFTELGYDLTALVGNGIANATSVVRDDAGNIIMALKDGTSMAITKNNPVLVEMFEELGYDLVDGTIIGIDEQMSAEAQKLADLFGFPYEKAAEENEVHSPSELFKRLGINIVEGLIAGLGVLYTKLKDTWTTLPAWFQNFINIIISQFTGMNADVGELFGETKDTIEEAWSEGNFSTIGNNAILGLIGGLLSEKIPVLEPAVQLVKNGWDTVTKWVNGFFGNTDNDERISLIRNAWTTVSSWVNSLFGNTDNDERVGLLKSGWSTVSSWVHSLFGNTNNDESVSLLRSGWSTVSNWVHNLFGNTDNDERISLIRNAWTTVSGWVNDRKGSTAVTKEVGLTQGFLGGVLTVAAWLLLDSIFGGKVTKAVDLVKGNWDGQSIAGWCADGSSLVVRTNLTKGNWAGETIASWCADSSSLSVKVSLSKNWSGTLSSWISSSWSKSFTINLRKGSGVTWNGKISGSGSSTKISFYKEGGFPSNGEMFIAREAGPELVGTIGSKTAVANNDQIVEAVSAGVYAAVSAAMRGESGENTRITINLDGKTIYENQQKIARGRGYDLGMGAFSFG